MDFQKVGRSFGTRWSELRIGTVYRHL
jgi:hypothetical protein